MSIDNFYSDLFAHLLAPVSAEQFAHDYLEQAPLYIKRSEPTYYNLLGIHELDALLRYGCPTEANQDLMAAKAAPDSRSERKYHLDSRERDYWAKLVNLYATGHTILYNYVHNRHPGIFQIAKAIELFLGSYTYANLFLSPTSGEPGFAVHIDAQDLFVLQLEGCKHWRIYRPQFALPTTVLSAPPVDYECLEAVLDVTLEPGDLLYLPRGFAHSVEGMGGEPALHLTIATEVPRVLDLLVEAVLVAAQQDPELRRCAPLLGEVTRFNKQVPETLKELIARIAANSDPELVADRVRGNIIARTVPPPDGYFARVQALPQPDTLYCRRAGLLWSWTRHLNPSGRQTLTLRFSGNVTTVPDRYKESLEAICSSATFRPKDLPGEITLEEKLSLVHSLVLQGFLTRCSGTTQHVEQDLNNSSAFY